jgi:proteasome lid subunit RPN8/RPN11
MANPSAHTCPPADAAQSTDATAPQQRERPRQLSLGSRTHAYMLAVAKAHAPRETGGLLLGAHIGAQFCVQGIEVLDNLDPEPGRRFAFDPVQVWRAVAAHERAGRNLLGFWHSHPEGPATLSALDRLHGWRRHAHAIVDLSAANRTSGLVLAYWLEADAEPLEILLHAELAATAP